MAPNSGGPLITKYRPRDWSEIIGHEDVVKALGRALSSPTHPHAFLFHGPSGIGKTTIARIVGTHLEADIVELDAATHTGVDQMRELVELGQHRPLTGNGNRLIILDEAHMLSRSSFNAILKMLEEPPAHLYIALCTTEPHRIPETIQTRTYPVELKRLSKQHIGELVDAVADVEGWKLRNDVFEEVVTAATGQPRKALTILQAVANVQSIDEVHRIIGLIEAEKPLLDLCRLIMAGRVGWDRVRPVLASIGDQEFEAAQLMVGGYFASVILNSENEAQARRAWTFLEALTFPSSTYDRKLAFLSAIGKVLWAQEQ